MKNKHIHVMTKYFYPVAAGIETNILETYSVLQKIGWNVTIHTTTDNYGQKNKLSLKENFRGLNIKRYVFGSENWGYVPDIDLNKFEGLLALHNFNVYYWRIFLQTLWLKITGQKKFKLVVTPHGGFNPEWNIFPTGVRLIKQIYHATLGTMFMNLVVDKVRAVSE